MLLLVAIVGCQQIQKNSSNAERPAPNRTAENPAGNRAPEPPAGTARDSNEGNLLLGNATNAAQSPDNFLLERPQFSMSYNRSRGGPNWVAWHVDAGDLGDEERGKFRPDPDLPRDWQIAPGDYRGSGYDRGHVCPSGDRTATREDNDATFFMSNMLPQTGELNRHVWADLENWVRDQVRAGSEIYQIAGGAGQTGTIANGKVAVPEVCWKVIVILPEGTRDKSRINAQTRVVAVGIPNVADKRLENADWRQYIVAPAKIEAAAKISLFSSLAPNVRNALKSKVDSGN